MSTNEAKSIKDDLVFNFLKCGSLILLATIVSGLLLTYASEVFEGICASIRWSAATFIVVKDGFYAGFIYWSWLPPTVAAVFVAAYLWITCVCAAMKKKYFLSQVYGRLDTAKAWMTFLSIVAVLLYAPVTKNPAVALILALTYGLVISIARLSEMDSNAIAERSLSQEE